MTWFGWLLAVYFGVNAAGTILLIGQEREPVTPRVAVVLVLIYGALTYGVASVGTK